MKLLKNLHITADDRAAASTVHPIDDSAPFETITIGAGAESWTFFANDDVSVEAIRSIGDAFMQAALLKSGRVGK